MTEKQIVSEILRVVRQRTDAAHANLIEAHAAVGALRGTIGVLENYSSQAPTLAELARKVAAAETSLNDCFEGFKRWGEVLEYVKLHARHIESKAEARQRGQAVAHAS